MPVVIVVDSNVLAYRYLPGGYTADAEALLGHDAEWSAPVLWRSEMRNILAGCMRRKALTFDQPAPAGDAEVIDLKGAYLMPGLWDVHIHPDLYGEAIRCGDRHGGVGAVSPGTAGPA